MPGPLDYRFHFANRDHPNLIAYFDMSTRTPGGLMKNLSRRGVDFDATINGTFRPVPPLIRAKRTPCWDMDGANDYLSLPNPITGLANFSIVAWMNADAFSGMLFSRAVVNDTYLYFNTTGGYSGVTGGVGLATPQAYPISVTHMVCLTYASQVCKLSVDGQQKSVATLGANPAEANCFIGKYFNASLWFNGRIDNWMAFNITLSQEQIWALVKSALPR